MLHAEQTEGKRKAQQAKQKGKQSITQLYAAAAAKKQKKTDWLSERLRFEEPLSY